MTKNIKQKVSSEFNKLNNIFEGELKSNLIKYSTFAYTGIAIKAHDLGVYLANNSQLPEYISRILQ